MIASRSILHTEGQGSASEWLDSEQCKALEFAGVGGTTKLLIIVYKS